LRGEFIVTIDPDDARDFDDAIHVRRSGAVGGSASTLLMSRLRGPDTRGSGKRAGAETAFTSDRVIPMLPERLSNGVCSLNAGVDRLTQSVLFIRQTRECKSARFARSVNSKRTPAYLQTGLRRF